MTPAHKRSVLSIVGRLVRSSVVMNDHAAEVIDLQAVRASRRRPDLAMRLTAELRGSSNDAPGPWRNLGFLITALVRQNLRAKLLSESQACAVVGVVSDRLHEFSHFMREKGLEPKDPTRATTGAVFKDLGERDGEDRQHLILEKSYHDTMQYRSLFSRPAAYALRPEGMSEDEFKRSSVWIQGYGPILVGVFLCIRPLVARMFSIRS